MDTRPPISGMPSPLEMLLAEDLQRRLREEAAEIEQRTKRLLATEDAQPPDQPPASTKS